MIKRTAYIFAVIVWTLALVALILMDYIGGEIGFMGRFLEDVTSWVTALNQTGYG